jgi:alpha-beta hydrolase superfamily lysophospholipase
MFKIVWTTKYKRRCCKLANQLTIPWKGKTLTATIHNPFGQKSIQKTFPLVIICHGFVGNRIGVDRLFVKTAKELTQDGYVVIRFDYSGCGESEGEYGKTGLDDLIEQTKTVIDYGSELPMINPDEITLLGHSLGGATAILTAARDSRVRKLILWAPVGQPLRDLSTIIGKETMDELDRSPYIDYQGYHLYNQFFHCLSRFSPIEEANSILGDVLLIHGSKDKDIPFSYSHQYDETFSKREHGSSVCKIIEGANHTFSNSTHFNELITTTRRWLTVQDGRKYPKKPLSFFFPSIF